MKLADIRGSWALVTGASSGIGREFCVQLAEARVNLVLVARRQATLDALADSLKRVHGINTLVVVQDLSVPGAASLIAGKVAEHGLRIRLLVNNAGIGQWGPFEAASEATYQKMIQVNMAALVAMSHAFLADLTESAPSAVVNVASPAAYQPVPFMAVYAATKAFVLSFSQALHGEWIERGILVQALIPGPTQTEFDDLAGAYPSALVHRGPPARVVQDSLAALELGTPVALSAKGTYRQRFFAGLFPPRMVISQVAKMFRPPDHQVGK